MRRLHQKWLLLLVSLVPSEAPVWLKVSYEGAGDFIRAQLSDRVGSVLRDYFGKISFYERYNRFEAVCTVPSHGDSCKLTRTSKGSTRAGAHEGRGRPVEPKHQAAGGTSEVGACVQHEFD